MADNNQYRILLFQRKPDVTDQEVGGEKLAHAVYVVGDADEYQHAMTDAENNGCKLIDETTITDSYLEAWRKLSPFVSIFEAEEDEAASLDSLMSIFGAIGTEVPDANPAR